MTTIFYTTNLDEGVITFPTRRIGLAIRYLKASLTQSFTILKIVKK